MSDLTLDRRALLRLRLARGFEEGAWDGPVARVVARGWGSLAAHTLARPLAWREGVRVIAIGGATLGGSGKTPLAIACARAIAQSGARVALVGHGYAARPGGARAVRPDDAVAEVGDEALIAARALAGVAQVVVAPQRQAAISLAAKSADVLVLDGVLQTTPQRATLSLLALDAAAPWGAGGVLPCGDLRAPRAALLRESDHAVVLEDVALRAECLPRSHFSARVQSRGAFMTDELVPWEQLAGLRIGLFLALARPRRVLAALARRGLLPRRIVQVPDHGWTTVSEQREPIPLNSRHAVDLWLASPKCAVHLARARVPHAVIEHDVALGPDLAARLAQSLRDRSLRGPPAGGESIARRTYIGP